MSQNFGVRQGDCMAPVILLFMVMAFNETLETEWTRIGMNMITLQQRSHSPQEIGTLTVHKEKTFSQGNLLTLFCVLYVDNDTFPLEDRLQIEWGLSLIHNNFVKFGLEMHICGGRKASKTKCIFFHHQVFLTEIKLYHVRSMVRIRCVHEVLNMSRESRMRTSSKEKKVYIPHLQKQNI